MRSTPEPEADALFEIRTGTSLGAVVIDVVGEVDMATAPQLAAALDPSRYTAERVVVNLSDVSFIDSSGLNALVAHARDLTKQGVTLMIVSPTSSHVRRVFEMTHLTEALGVVDTLDAALR